jgi:hypothetical protein
VFSPIDGLTTESIVDDDDMRGGTAFCGAANVTLSGPPSEEMFADVRDGTGTTIRIPLKRVPLARGFLDWPSLPATAEGASSVEVKQQEAGTQECDESAGQFGSVRVRARGTVSVCFGDRADPPFSPEKLFLYWFIPQTYTRATMGVLSVPVRDRRSNFAILAATESAGGSDFVVTTRSDTASDIDSAEADPPFQMVSGLKFTRAAPTDNEARVTFPDGSETVVPMTPIDLTQIIE